MLFTDDQNNNGKVLYLGNYHPWHGGNNPAFDDFSRRILDVKRRHPRGIDFFFSKLNPKLRAGITIVAFPSSTPANQESGVVLVARRLARINRVDGTSCLRRHSAVSKSATGGKRSEEKHLKSILVEHTDLITGKSVLLLDDVSTSGSSIAAGLKLLRAHRPAYLQALCLGKTVQQTP